MNETILYGLLNKKIKESGGTSNPIPTKLSDLSQDSEHRTVSDAEKEIWNNKSDFSGSYNDLTDKPSSLPASDVFEWAKSESKPTYTADEIGADSKGSASTAESNAKKYTDDKFTGLVGTSPENLNTIYELANAIEENQNAVDTIENAITNKVSKIEGKGLSTNDLTDELKDSYDSAVEHANSNHAPVNAQENVIESISIDGRELEIIDKNIELPSYSSSIIRDASGTDMVLADSAGKQFAGMHIYGRSTQKSTTGAQLIDLSTVIDGHYISDFDGNDIGENSLLCASDFISISEMETLYMSHKSNSCAFYDENKVFLSGIDSGNEHRIVNVPEGAKYFRATVYIEDKNNFMLNSGTTPFPYEPYTGGKPSPSPDYPQEIVSAGQVLTTGAQLFDISLLSGREINGMTFDVLPNGGIHVYGTATAQAYVKSVEFYLPPGTYYVSGSDIQKKVYFYVSIRPQDESSAWKNYANGVFSITEADKARAYVNVNAGTVVDTVIYPMLNTGTVALPWEPYTGGVLKVVDTDIRLKVSDGTDQSQITTISTPNGLPGIPVSSNGNYTDADGQQWVCDEVDFGRGVYVQRIGQKDVLESQNVWRGEGIWGNIDNYETLAFYSYNNGTNSELDWGKLSDIALCNFFTRTVVHNTSNIGFFCGSYVAFRVPRALLPTWNEENPSNEPFVQWLQEKKDSGNPVIVQYILAEPIETPLSAEVIAAYRSLHTNYPTTAIGNDAGAWMSVGYVADTKNYINGEHQKLSNDFNQSIESLDNTKVDKIPGMGLSTNDYTTAEKTKLKGLNNYNDDALKARVASIENDYANKGYVAEQISNASHLKKEIVTEVPDKSVAEENVIYMLKDDSVVGDDKYSEYMLVNGAVVKIGDTSIDLSDYAKTADVDEDLNEKVDKNVLLSILNNKPTVQTLDEFLNLQRTDKVYQVKIPKFASNPTSICEKLGANAGLVFEPSTDTVEGQDDYADKIEFMWWHNNYIRDDNGYAIVTALEGDSNYAESGSVDVGSCGMSFYYKWDDSNADYTILSWSPSPHQELGLIPFSANVPGHSYWCLSAYPSITASDGFLRSQPNGKIAKFQSYNNMITNYQKKGNGYWGAGIERNTFQIIFNTLMGATKSSKTLFAGVTSYSFQFDAAVERDTEDTFFPVTASQAASLEVGCYVSVGYGSISNGALSKDRGYLTIHSYADDVKILRIEDMDDGNKAVYLDIDSGFTTTPVTLSDEVTSPIIMSSMHMWTGETNKVIGKHNGSAISNTSGRHPYRVQGVEYALGAYVVASDTVVDIQSDYSKNVYVAPKGVPHSSSDATIRNSYTLVGNIPASSDGNGSDYWIGDITINEETGAWHPSSEGSSNVQGVGDRYYAGGTATSGIREYLQSGGLWNGSSAGSACLAVGYGLSGACWDCCGCD